MIFERRIFFCKCDDRRGVGSHPLLRSSECSPMSMYRQWCKARHLLAQNIRIKANNQLDRNRYRNFHYSPNIMSEPTEEVAPPAPIEDNSTTYTNPAVNGETPAEMTLPPDAIAFAGKCFELARQGVDDLLRPYLERGLPPNLMNEKGDYISFYPTHLFLSSVLCAGNTLVMLAAYNGRTSTVRLLHEKGADINRCNDRGQSPLAGAIFKNETETIKTLIELGADPRAGIPSAIHTARIFKQDHWLDQLGATEEEKTADLPTFNFGAN